MSTATLPPTDIQAFTADDFVAPAAFTQFCSNGGQPLQGIIGGERVRGSMNAVLDIINPGTQEVLAGVCEMGWDEVNLAVEGATQAFNGNGDPGWKDTTVDERAALVMKLVELCQQYFPHLY